MYNYNDMINRIKKVKKEKCLTNEELSTISGVPYGTLNKILGSETKDPSVSAVIKIAESLNVSADYIIFGESKANKANVFYLTELEKLVLCDFRDLDKEGQNRVIEYISMLKSSGKFKKATSTEIDKMQA